MRQTLVSFDLKADFGVFKKPDVNEGMQLTFNLLHKPALLGILGAIAGLHGYRQYGILPEYYNVFRDLRVAIEPLEHEKGNFAKTVIRYTNTIGYANADGNLIVTEQTLYCPAYRCYLLLDLDHPFQNLLHEHIRAGEAVYLPYFGKNECTAWWEIESVRRYDFEPFIPRDDFQVHSIFVRERDLKSHKVEPKVSFALRQVTHAATFAYFERLPIDFFVGDAAAKSGLDFFSTVDNPESKGNKPFKFVQYELAEFVFTDWTLRPDSELSNLYEIRDEINKRQVVQLF